MNLLALDTSSDACSVAVQIGVTVFERHDIAPRQHSRLLLPMIRELLGEACASLRDLDALVVGNGPGSFIGVRIAGSVAQGLAFGAGLRIVPVSSLAAVALECSKNCAAENIAVAQDAHMQEVYIGLFEASTDGLPRPVGQEFLHGQEPVRELGDRSWMAAGSGWQLHPALYEANRDHLVGTSEIKLPRASFLLPAGAKSLEDGGAVAPDQLSPAYLRLKVAEKPGKHA